MLNEGDVAWYEITVVENVLYIIPSSSSSLDVEKKALNFNFKKAMYRVVFLQKSVIYCLTGSKGRTQYHCFFSLHQVMKVCEPDIQKKRWSFHWPWVRPCLVPSRLSLSLSMKKLRTKEVGKEKLLIFLPLMNPCASSPVTRVSRSPLCENRRA